MPTSLLEMKSIRSETLGSGFACAIRRSISADRAANAGPARPRSGRPAKNGKPPSSRSTFRRSVTGCIAGKLSQAAAALPATRQSILNKHQPAVAGFGAPGLAGAAQHLPHLRATLTARESLELLRHRIEPDDGVGHEVGQPDLVLLVDMDRIAAAAGVARQEPGLPSLGRRIVAADLAGVPEADPEQALGVGPDAAGAGALLMRLDDVDVAGCLV